MYRRMATLAALCLSLSGAFFQPAVARAQSTQSNPGWVPELSHYVYYLEMPVATDKAAIAQLAAVMAEKTGVLSCVAKGSPVSYFVLHTSAPVSQATMQEWAISAGTTLTKAYAHGTRAYQAWQTRPGDTRIQRKGSH